MRRGIHSSTQAHLQRPLLIAIVGSAVLLLSSVLSNGIIQSAFAQPSDDQGRVIEESQPSLPSEEQERLIEESGPGIVEEERLIEESQPSLPSGEQERLIAELIDRGTFQMPVEDIKKIIDLKSAMAPIAVAGNNVYAVWWDNKTGNWEIFFRASPDNGRTFGDEINLSNDTTRSDDGSIAALGNNVYVTWWDTSNQTGLREPVFIASNDNGATFGERVRLSGNEPTVTSGSAGSE
jgi:hypothetical protein